MRMGRGVFYRGQVVYNHSLKNNLPPLSCYNKGINNGARDAIRIKHSVSCLIQDSIR